MAGVARAALALVQGMAADGAGTSARAAAPSHADRIGRFRCPFPDVGRHAVLALAHPLLAVFILRSIWLFASGAWLAVGLAEQLLFAVDVANIVGSYYLFAFLGRKPMSAEERVAAVGSPWAGVPFYWIMLSVAAWQAVKELSADPFLWRKTPHAPSSIAATRSEETGDLREKKEVQTEDHHRADRPENTDHRPVHIFAHDAAL